MERYIPKSALVAEIERRMKKYRELVAKSHGDEHEYFKGMCVVAEEMFLFIYSLEVKEVDLIINTIIAECCDWLAMNTNLNNDKIEGCRNLMLTVKEEQLSK